MAGGLERWVGRGVTGPTDQTVRLVLPRAALWRRPRYLAPASAVERAAAGLMRASVEPDSAVGAPTTVREAAGGEVLGDDCGP